MGSVARLEDYRNVEGATSADREYKRSDEMQTGLSAEFSGRVELLKDLVGQIETVYASSSQANWDSDGATAISLVAYVNALAFADSLVGGLPHPRVYADNDGLFDFEWHYEGRIFSIYVGPEDYALWAKYFNDDNRGSGRFSLNKRLPKEYQETIRQMYGLSPL